MLAWWLLFAGVAIVLAILGLFVSSKRGQKRLLGWRSRLFKRTLGVSREAIGTWRQDTPRRRRRAARRAQPHRLTFGHRRPDDDPPPLRKLVGSALDEMRTAAANRQAARRPLGLRVLNWFRGIPADWVPGKCGAETVDGTKCKNRRMIGKNHCRFHPPTLNEMLLTRR